MKIQMQETQKVQRTAKEKRNMSDWNKKQAEAIRHREFEKSIHAAYAEKSKGKKRFIEDDFFDLMVILEMSKQSECSNNEISFVKEFYKESNDQLQKKIERWMTT